MSTHKDNSPHFQKQPSNPHSNLSQDPSSSHLSAQHRYEPSRTNLFLRYLPTDIDDYALRDIFSVYGHIISSMVMRDIHSGQSLGTAFVRYQDHREARTAFFCAQGMPLKGKTVSVQWARQHHDETPAGDCRVRVRKLFLRNLPETLRESTIKKLMSKWGTVTQVSLHSDTNPDSGAAHNRRMIAFVTFDEDGAALHAMEAVHNTCPFPCCHGVPLMAKLIDDTLKSRKHKLLDQRSCSASVSPHSETAITTPRALNTHYSHSSSTDDGLSTNPHNSAYSSNISGDAPPYPAYSSNFSGDAPPYSAYSSNISADAPPYSAYSAYFNAGPPDPSTVLAMPSAGAGYCFGCGCSCGMYSGTVGYMGNTGRRPRFMTFPYEAYSAGRRLYCHDPYDLVTCRVEMSPYGTWY